MNKLPAFPLFTFAALLLSGPVADAQPVSPLEQAQAALAAHDIAAAAALLEPLTSVNAKDAAVFDALSQVRLAQKNVKEAVELAEKATALDATNPAYFSQLGMALGQRMGEVSFIQQAVMSGRLRKAFARAVELDPKGLPGLIGLARFYAAAPEIAGGSIEKAREFALRVQRIDPFLGEVELGNVAEHDESDADALAHFETAARLKPGSANAQNLCGRVLARLGRKDEARVRFEAALKINPAFDAAKKGLAALDAATP